MRDMQLHHFSTFAQRLVTAPQLTHLHLRNFSPCKKVIDGILSLKNLSDVGLDLSGSPKAMINQTLFFSLGGLQCLSKFTIRLPGDVDWLPSSTTTTPIVFSKLVHLTLHCSFDDALLLLTSTRLPSLQKLVHQFLLPIPPLTPSFKWKEFTDRLRISTTSKITSLHLKPSTYLGQDIVGIPRVWAIMKTYPGISFHEVSDSLLQLKLTDLELHFPLFHSLTVDDFAAMGAAWPDMTQLRLHAISLQDSIPDTSVLRLITTAFPRLSSLGIDMDAERICKPSLVSSSHPLEVLTVGLPKWPNTLNAKLKFAALVDSLFPNLRSILTTPGTNNHLSQVLDILEALRSSRKRERNRIRTQYCLPDIKQEEDDDEDEDDEDEDD
ncbi:hypothetical protein CVT24_000989 [Panaeolus cyanescens]|uniref:F-box domain-containing protein n=1 Tax=Panaeolus cyanescens TaxID=181874 RepID=A0A409YCJ5_9AGAR|nr:hypothetical protein CVT24_000989 [Panaeolus cyanescens]